MVALVLAIARPSAKGRRVHSRPLNPPVHVAHTGRVVAMVLSTARPRAKGRRMHSRPVNPPVHVAHTGLVVAMVLSIAPALRKGLRVHISELSDGSTNFRETWFFFGNLARGCLATPGAAVAMAVRRAIPLRSRQVALEYS